MRRFYVREAAKELSISVSLLYSLLEQRMIRHERHGLGRGRYVIPEDALDEYRKRQEVGVSESIPASPLPRLKRLSLS